MAPRSVDPREFGRYVAMAQVGMEMVAPIGIGLAADHFLGWSPWGLIVGAVVGLVGGIGHLAALSRRNERNGPKQSNGKDPS